ncbi:hypothetical protein AA309_04225 [Microvirga vignae]|uniref:Energy transducer TonB n=1 Tax=Microvirga vignae TaxID=1225564 RepID=A0A0H1RHA2_9HYPH|nr:cell envelope integrity protein TolA [Microvirga vignae]KLK94439.1 hypothetical protein AA309_04225 [Microvirga vignae]
MKRLLSILVLGIAAGLSGCVTASDPRANLKALFHDQVKACYKLPAEGVGPESVVVDVHLKPDGTLERPPEIKQGSVNSPVAQAALRAVKECTPFRVPAEIAPRYEEWRVMHITFRTD